jgi:hypothetical protein
MKKFLVIGGIVVGLGLVGAIVLSFFLGNIVTAGVNSFGPKITQTKVTLGSASISPLSGSGTLSDLVVGNPKGWSDADLCSLGKVHLDVQPFSILGDHIIINEISIEAPEFNYETKIVASNVGDLLKTIEALSGSKDTPQATTKSGKPIKFEVKKFRLQNGWVRVGVGPAALKLPMPPVSLDDIGTAQGGVTPDQLVFAVMRSVTPSIISATTQAAGKLVPTAGAAAAEAIKGLFGGDKKKP